MALALHETPFTALADLAAVPIAFVVDRVLDVAAPDGGLGGLVLAERPLAAPYVKDYDRDGEPLASLPDLFDLTGWGLIVARDGGRCVGGAVVVAGAPGVEMLEGRDDLAVLWDLRVAPGRRGAGVGAALFRAAEAWARARGCGWLKVETQNVNVDACRFYARRGCVLGAVHRFAYPTLPDETQLLWYKRLDTP